MLVTYSLTIRRLQLEAAKCYSDPDDHLMMMSQTSDRLRRHQLNSKLRSSPSASSQFGKHTSLREVSSSASIPSPSSPRSPTLLDVTSKQNQNDWP